MPIEELLASQAWGKAEAGQGALAQVRGGALRRQEVCPQRRPVGRSRETLTCTLGERLGGRKGAGGGAEPEALTWRDR